MKMKIVKGIRNLFVTLLLAAAAFAGWRMFDRPEANAYSGNFSYSVTENRSGGDYKTLSMSRDNVHSGYLILVNPKNACRSGGAGSVSVYDLKNNSYKVRDKNVLLNEEVIRALNEMMADFDRAKSDRTVNVISGYRTEDEQRQLLDAQTANRGEAEAAMWVAKPGFSEHHTGLTLDFGLYFENGTSASFDGRGKYAWITENCLNYGFVVRYPEGKEALTGISYEPWHLRYVGVPHAYMMKEKNFCLEEYIDFLWGFQFDGKRLEVNADGRQYEIYFTAGTKVSVPENRSYEISGNNADGFIVTVELITNQSN